MSGDSALTLANNDAGNQDPRLHYRRLRAPSEPGESLQLPPLSETVENWPQRSNTSLHGSGKNSAKESANASANAIEINGLSLPKLQSLGRSEVRKLAHAYTRRYRDVELDDRDANSIVMSGHQPLLFHPGVWYKNFALSSVGRAVNAVPINLIVDNDVSGAASIKCPVYADGKASVCMIPFDGPHAAVPHESRLLTDESVFSSFSERATRKIRQCFDAHDTPITPLIPKLWQHVMSSRDSLAEPANLGAALAAGRHRLEQEAGLNTLEIPVSLVSQTDAFARFAASILNDQAAFNRSYNARLNEYRGLHGIRSHAHPVPELETNDGWLESPFWIWSDEEPVRKRLFVKPAGDEIWLSDQSDWRAKFEAKHLAEAWSEVAADRVSIRPRALITTMFSRMVLSDLFLHGIGGAKYDQLTDVIADDFFGIKLPTFSTLTATIHLPLGYPMVTPQDQTKLRHQIRQRKYHPEKFLTPSAATQEIIDRKRAAIEDAQLSPIERHREIEETNQRLAPFVADQIESLSLTMNGLADQIRNSQILNSREYSFCMFAESLIDDLRRMSECQ